MISQEELKELCVWMNIQRDYVRAVQKVIGDIKCGRTNSAYHLLNETLRQYIAAFSTRPEKWIPIGVYMNKWMPEKERLVRTLFDDLMKRYQR